MQRGEVWVTFNQIKSEIKSLAEDRIPEIYREIMAQNKRWAEEEENLR